MPFAKGFSNSNTSLAKLVLILVNFARFFFSMYYDMPDKFRVGFGPNTSGYIGKPFHTLGILRAPGLTTHAPTSAPPQRCRTISI